MKKILVICALVSLCLFSCTGCTEGQKGPVSEKEQTVDKTGTDPITPAEAPGGLIIVAYVTYWDTVIPDPTLVTHINYAFGKVANTFDKVEISNENRLKAIVKLKEKNDKLKVLLSIGGWGAGNFSEMAANQILRKSFCEDCLAKCKTYGLDGIDLDWEYPTSNMAGISSSPSDTRNYTSLLKNLRETLGNDYLITMASSANAKYVDFGSCIQYMNFVNLMTYDMGRPPKHHSALYPSAGKTSLSVDESVELHNKAGVPYEKIVVGAPFYCKAADGNASGDGTYWCKMGPLFENYTEMWDDTAKVPYLADIDGNMAYAYDNPSSIGLKAEYVIQKKLRGMMFWNWEGDNSTTWEMTHAIYDKFFPNE